MRKGFLIAAVAATAVLDSGAASAEISAHNILAKIDAGDQTPTALLVGAASGFLVANAWLKYHNRPTLFCSPGKLTIMPEQTVEIMRSYVAANPSANSTEAATVLLDAFQYTFPCPKAVQ